MHGPLFRPQFVHESAQNVASYIPVFGRDAPKSRVIVKILQRIRQTLGRSYRRLAAGVGGPIRTREQFPPEEFERQEFSGDEFVADDREERK